MLWTGEAERAEADWAGRQSNQDNSESQCRHVKHAGTAAIQIFPSLLVIDKETVVSVS